MTPQQFYDEELGVHRRQWEEHRIFPALFETVAKCGLWGIPIPGWAQEPVLEAIRYVYDNEPDPDGAEGGGYASHRGRTAMDFAHYLRWIAVKNQLDIRNLTSLPASKGRPKKDAANMTKAAILANAAAMLRRNDERSSLSRVRQVESLEESYVMVEASRSAGETRFLFERLVTFGNP
ncbi:hypothetical protein MesoLj113a_38550 [Mesorhizobium sp. 113-1-2]|uniref:hypothetical protein n=1 Tax=Mesorhizobium sp. 113-1-2 TaxID=2744515 RepID=UPI00192917F8|nr:hypothetical protein [Mesorhizobium sp. 113-1-2]BCG72697.1 hypothetical protein MesoLj113a_38550 [Mesorhizobium sp. 113-1-2]